MMKLQKFIDEVKEKSVKELNAELQKVKKKIIYVTGEDIENARNYLIYLFHILKQMEKLDLLCGINS